MVYERSRGKPEDRGAGIGMPLALLRTLFERDFVDANMAHLQATKAPFVLRADAVDDALRAWDASQSAEGWRLVTLGQVMGRTFVQDVPGGQQMDATTEQWWTALMREQHWYVTEDVRDQQA
jgi:hypothetical protein